MVVSLSLGYLWGCSVFFSEIDEVVFADVREIDIIVIAVEGLTF